MTNTITNSRPLNDSYVLAASPEAGCRRRAGGSGRCAGLTEFKSAVPINDFLSRLLLFQAQDRISPRRAAVMAYTCNLLLHTLPAIGKEVHPPNSEPQRIIIDMPRPDRD